MNLRGWFSTPWPVVVAVLVALTLGVAFAPFPVAIGVAGAALGALLIWKFGPREGVWFLFLATIPLREPMSIDVVGTASLFPTDVLLLGLAIATARRDALRSTWRESPSFRIGLALLILGIPGLVTATRLFWGVSVLYRAVASLAMLYVARSMIRSGRDAQRALVAVVVGLLPAAVYGLYQATLPYGADLPDWSMHFSAWDAAGRRSVRIFSTFSHPLHLSHYMSIGFGMALGLASSTLRKGHKWLLVLIGLTAAFCNLFTSSVGGLLGMSGVVVTIMILQRRRRVVLLAPALLVLILLVAPPVMMAKLGRVLTGQATSGAARMVTYTQALAVVRDNPLLGVGWGGVRTALEHDYRETRADAVAFTAENYFLQRAVALGIPGFVLVMLLCILFFRNAILPRGQLPDPSWPRAAILTAGVAFYLQGQTFPTGYMNGILILWLLIGSAERMRESVVKQVEGQ